MVYHNLNCPICKSTILKRIYKRKTVYPGHQKWIAIGYHCFKCQNIFDFVSGLFSILSHPDTKFINLNDKFGNEMNIYNGNYMEGGQ